MNHHLCEISSQVAADAHAVVILDGASWHNSHGLVVPSNITLLALPPHLVARIHLVAGIGLWRARSDRYRRAARFLTLGQSSCHSKRTKIAVITSRSSGTE
jgi:hypothetical protein